MTALLASLIIVPGWVVIVNTALAVSLGMWIGWALAKEVRHGRHE